MLRTVPFSRAGSTEIYMLVGLRRSLAGIADRRFRRGPTPNRRSSERTPEGADRIGTTKTAESDNYVPVPPDLAREITEWITAHLDRNNPRALLFPNSAGTAFSVGLPKAASKTASREGWDPRFNPSGAAPDVLHAHAEPRDGQRHAESPPTHRPPNDSEALCQGHPGKLASGCRGA